MPMKAVDNVDNVLIERDGPFSTRVVAKYDPDTNTMEMVGGFAGYVPVAMDALRRYKKERNIPAAPVRVLYW